MRIRTYREYVGQSKTVMPNVVAGAHCTRGHAGIKNIEKINGRYVCCECLHEYSESEIRKIIALETQ